LEKLRGATKSRRLKKVRTPKSWPKVLAESLGQVLDNFLGVFWPRLLAKIFRQDFAFSKIFVFPRLSMSFVVVLSCVCVSLVVMINYVKFSQRMLFVVMPC
jgi:hypothetical protein